MDRSSLYRPLDRTRKEIRLLHVRPSTNLTDPVEGDLEVVSLESEARPQYEAISYVWAEVSGTAPITINNVLVEDAPASAVKVLRQFRLRSEVRNLWIDAICINQGDVVERSDQVGMMSQIYRSTTTTLVWLGDADDMSEAALRDIIWISKEIYPRIYRDNNCPLPRQLLEDVDPKEIMTNTSISDFRPIGRLFERPWFNRLWVVQESALAPKCLCRCGDLEIDCDDLCRAICCFAGANNFDEMDIESSWRGVLTAATRGVFVGHLNGFLEVSLLYQVSIALQCRDPRDRIYAIHGLTGASNLTSAEQKALGIEVDYNKPLLAIFRDITRFGLLENENLDLLYRVQTSTGDELTLQECQRPSWVPDWRPGPAHAPRSVVEAYKSQPRSRHRPDLDLIASDTNTNRLRLMGLDIDKVARVFPVLIDRMEEIGHPQTTDGDGTASERMFEEFMMLMNACTEYLSDPAKEETAKEMLMTIMKRGGQQSIVRELDNIFCTTILSPTNLLQMNEVRENPRTKPGYSEFELRRGITANMYAQCLDHRLFVTDQGRICLGPRWTDVGDSVVAFFGGRMPFVLRAIPFDTSTRDQHPDVHLASGQSPSSYQLLGGCYKNDFEVDDEISRLIQSGQNAKVFEIW